ncbi:MAG: hypothetical protein AAF458_13725 [Pseudomonadota bacterium]
MPVQRITRRPSDLRAVPVLTEPGVAHYPEFADFLSRTFELEGNPLAEPGWLDVDGRAYEFVFIGRSGQPFPAGVEISALVAGLEPMDTDQVDRDLWTIMEWLVDGVGEPWSVEALRTTGRIYRVIPDPGPER